MKKINALLVCAFALLLTACSESKYEFHQNGFWLDNRFQTSIQLYADQTHDSVKVVATDPWVLEISDDTQWLGINPSKGEAIPGTPIVNNVNLYPALNTLGKNRTTNLILRTTNNDIPPLAINQCSWLNITSPDGKVDNSVPYADRKATFDLELDATMVDDIIMFHIYQDGATLYSDQEWLQPETNIFNKGSHTVKLNFSKNTAIKERHAKLTLASGGIISQINVVQKKADKEENK